MTADLTKEFLFGLSPPARPIAQRVVSAVLAHAPLDVGIKWRQLTFALNKDFDHWICAVAVTRSQVNLAFHFGSLLTDHAGVFEATNAKFVRKIGFVSADEVGDAAVGDLLTQALDALPRFRLQVSGR